MLLSWSSVPYNLDVEISLLGFAWQSAKDALSRRNINGHQHLQTTTRRTIHRSSTVLEAHCAYARRTTAPREAKGDTSSIGAVEESKAELRGKRLG